MPFYVGDYLRDTLRLTRDQHGGYLLLLMAYWANGGPLPDDDEQLAAITKATPIDWKRLRTVLAQLPFFEVRDGKWFQKRADEELATATDRYKARSNAGKSGNAKRWGVANGSQSDTPSDHNATARRHAGGSQPQPQPHELGFDPPGQKPSSQRAAARDRPAAPPAAEPGWEQNHPKWAEFREKIGHHKWSLWFQRARLNGSETSLIAASAFERQHIETEFGTELEAHFGEPISIKFVSPAAVAS